MLRKRKTWVESGNFRQHRQRRELWIVIATGAVFAAAVGWLLWVMS